MEMEIASRISRSAGMNFTYGAFGVFRICVAL
jgi:hypothetical protein